MNTIRVILFNIILLLFLSCSNNNPDIRLLEDVPLYIIKYKNPLYKTKIIAAHPIIDPTITYFDGSLGNVNYVFDTTSYQLIYEGSDIEKQFNQKRGLIGSTPYIELSNDYLLVDWRWQDYLPISSKNLYHNKRNIAYNSVAHFFVMNTTWEDLDSLSQIWNNSDVWNNFDVDEWRTISCQALERYMSGDESPLTYIETYTPNNFDNTCKYVYLDCCFNETAFIKYKEGGADEYDSYANLVDSLFSEYAIAINTLISKNELKKWTYEVRD